MHIQSIMIYKSSDVYTIPHNKRIGASDFITQKEYVSWIHVYYILHIIQCNMKRLPCKHMYSIHLLPSHVHMKTLLRPCMNSQTQFAIRERNTCIPSHSVSLMSAWYLYNQSRFVHTPCVGAGSILSTFAWRNNILSWVKRSFVMHMKFTTSFCANVMQEFIKHKSTVILTYSLFPQLLSPILSNCIAVSN